eukprot:TRINITY_DN8782_c0_g1_i1.p1 TRINITY_DN8782_c0_g1~~TRINITY_DN8782_c0_g1_i1.p1  ORF type:complete len:486 (+),score=148.24 TRINITY_DN8782_c0_g1_i1:762-2219(+)
MAFDLTAIFPLLRLETSETKGRFVVATTDLDIGQVVVEAEPYSSAVFPTFWERNCHACFIQNDNKLLSCAACKRSWYCSKECQKSAWPVHKGECKLFQKHHPAGSRVPPTMYLVMLRALLRASAERKAAAKTAGPTKTSDFDVLLSLQSHFEDRGEQRQAMYKELGGMVQRTMADEFPASLVAPEDLAELFAKMDCNSFAIFNTRTIQLGFGLYPTASFFNHSCAPNVIVSFDNARLYMRTIARVPAGTELCFSYTDIHDPTFMRQAALQRSYFFQCRCSRCVDPAQEAINASLVGYRCFNADCPAALVASDSDVNVMECPSCGVTKLKSEILELAASAEKLHNDATEAFDKRQELKNATQMMERAFKLRQEVLHRHNRLVQDSRVKLINYYPLSQRPEDAIPLLEQSIDFLSTVGHGYHLTLAFNWYLLGTLFIQSGMSQRARGVECLRKSYAIYAITHGATHPWVLEIAQRIGELDRRASKYG